MKPKYYKLFSFSVQPKTRYEMSQDWELGYWGVFLSQSSDILSFGEVDPGLMQSCRLGFHLNKKQDINRSADVSVTLDKLCYLNSINIHTWPLYELSSFALLFKYEGGKSILAFYTFNSFQFLFFRSFCPFCFVAVTLTWSGFSNRQFCFVSLICLCKTSSPHVLEMS